MSATSGARNEVTTNLSREISFRNLDFNLKREKGRVIISSEQRQFAVYITFAPCFLYSWSHLMIESGQSCVSPPSYLIREPNFRLCIFDYTPDCAGEAGAGRETDGHHPLSLLSLTSLHTSHRTYRKFNFAHQSRAKASVRLRGSGVTTGDVRVWRVTRFADKYKKFP